MRAGDLRYLVNVQAFTTTQDPTTGEMVEAWSTVGQEWASIEGVSGREYLAAAAEQAETTFRVVMRHRPDVKTEMRLEHEGDTYQIKAILPDKRRRRLVLMCEVMA
ncbi:phage head closure protein [Halomonas ventosae]|uniref:SPP1 family predicted phage head-tail adaptor n=1 Tax=Halomonas ventosae TaxID=229007 RepID=A0A2T0VLC4_9GAMM|nr:phage head closure protein [Halomonas ventosae]PRY70982.1 SPP1 family predicted phage head-tail adaptor [Halomonas ventosae]